MSYQWSDYLSVADHLIEFSGQSSYAEACLRASMSRAYYAALLTARSLLRDQWGIEVPATAELHRFIPDWFLSEDNVAEQKIGTLLLHLRERRRRSDYDDNIANVSSLAHRSLADAKEVIEWLTTL